MEAPAVRAGRRPWRRDLRWLLLILGLGAVLRVALFADFRQKIPMDFTVFEELDDHTWHEFGKRIAAGDLLYRDAFIPCHTWARAIAPPEQWVDWYGGTSAFYQAPLYGYLVGVVYAIAGDDPDGVRVFQILLGLVIVLIVYLVARQLFEDRVPLLAAMLAAVYTPMMFFELTMERVTVVLLLHVFVLLLLIVALRTGRALRWGALGIALGLDFLARPSLYFLVPPLLLLVAAQQGRPWTWPLRLRGGLAYAAGFVVALSPLVIRNAVVGQPAFQVDTRGPVSFISGNATDAVVDAPGGFYLPASTAEIVHATRNRLVPTVLEVLRRYPEERRSYLSVLLHKARRFWRDYEVPDNVNYYHFRENLWVLRLPLTTYTFIFPLAIVGIAVTRRRWRELLAAHVLAAAVFINTIAFLVVARTRITIVPYLICFAAAGLAWTVNALRARRWRRIGLAGGLALGALLLSAPPPSWIPSSMEGRRMVTDLEQMRVLGKQRIPDEARVVSFGEARALLFRVKRMYEEGRYAECIYPLESVLAAFPGLGYTRHVLARCYFEIYLQDGSRADCLESARRELAALLREDPNPPYAAGLIAALDEVTSAPVLPMGSGSGTASTGTTAPSLNP